MYPHPIFTPFRPGRSQKTADLFLPVSLRSSCCGLHTLLFFLPPPRTSAFQCSFWKEASCSFPPVTLFRPSFCVQLLFFSAELSPSPHSPVVCPPNVFLFFLSTHQSKCRSTVSGSYSYYVLNCSRVGLGFYSMSRT